MKLKEDMILWKGRHTLVHDAYGYIVYTDRGGEGCICPKGVENHLKAIGIQLRPSTATKDHLLAQDCYWHGMSPKELEKLKLDPLVIEVISDGTCNKNMVNLLRRDL